MNILITSAGRRVSLVKAFQTTLVKFFSDGKVFTTDLQPGLSAACCISDGSFSVRKVTEPGYIDDLLQLCKANQIRMLVPTIDTELLVLSKNKDVFLKNGVQIIVSSCDLVEKCRDKRKIGSFFAAHGIEVPRPVSKLEPTFPLFIKPYDGSLSVDTFLIKRKEELTEYHLNNEKLLFMEYVDGIQYNEYTVDMYYGKDYNVKCIVPRKRIEIRSGEINKGVTCKNELVTFLKDRLGYIEGAVGCLTVQVFLKTDSSRVVGIEINPRFGGGYPLSYHAGANYPEMLIKEYFLNGALSYFDNWKDNLLMLRYDNEVLVYGNSVL